jgi:hypothetical protein
MSKFIGEEMSAPRRPKDLKPAERSIMADGPGLRSLKTACEKVGQVGYECHTELEFPNERDAKEHSGLGLTPGKVYLHKCERPGSFEGDFVEVTSASLAVEEGQKHCACVKPLLSTVTATARKKCMRKAS